MATIHFNATSNEGLYILIDLHEVQAFCTLHSGGVDIWLKGGQRIAMHGEALPGFLAAMAEYRRLNSIVLMPEER